MSTTLIKTALVVGTGAIGALYGAMLDRSGVDVSTVVRRDFGVVTQHGFYIESYCFGNFVFRPTAVLQSPSEIDSFPDVILVCAKTHQSYVDLIRPAVGPHTAIVLLQNGLGIEPIYQSAFPNNPIIGGLAFVCVNRAEPGRIVHLDYGRLVLGLYPSGEHPVVQALVQCFAGVTVPVKESVDILRDRWRKLIWNAPFNPLSAILKQTTDQILAVPELELLCKSIMSEVVMIAASEGFILDEDVVVRNIEDTRRMKPYKTSMLLDVEAGRPLERVTIVENAIIMAHTHGLNVPNLICINALLKGLYD